MLKTDKVKVVKDTPRDRVYTLSLTADELTWLEQVMATALRVYEKNRDGLAAELRANRQSWRDQLYEQGYRPF